MRERETRDIMAKRPNTTTIKSAEDFGAAIEAAAANIGKVTSLKVAIPGAAASVKVATDRARRIPRLKGLHVVNVQVHSFEKGIAELQLSSQQAVAAPWPTKAAKPAKAAAKRSTAKAPAKRTPAKAAAKTPAKSTTAKRTPRKAAAK
jgi:hypothetical protein